MEDFRSVGFAFVAVSNEIGDIVRQETNRVILYNEDKKDAFRDLLKRNRFVFLGMTASRKQSVAGMQTCIEETNRSGIRFVYVYRSYRSYITTNLFVIQLHIHKQLLLSQILSTVESDRGKDGLEHRMEHSNQFEIKWRGFVRSSSSSRRCTSSRGNRCDS
mgnify:CR=1 FL=1